MLNKRSRVLALLLALAVVASACAGGGQAGGSGSGTDGGTQSSVPAKQESTAPTQSAAPAKGSNVVFTKGSAHITASGGTVTDEDVPFTSGTHDEVGVTLSFGRPDPSGRGVVGVTIYGAPRVRIFVKNFIVEPRSIGGPDPCTVTVSRNDTSGVAGTFACADVRFGGVELSGGFGAVQGRFEATP